MKITALVPVKSNSERVPGKNFRLFNGRPLFSIILHTLENCPEIGQVIVNTDSDAVKKYAAENLTRTIIIDRPVHLSGEHVMMNTLIEHDIGHSSGEHFFQTHCTNPLLSERTISEAVSRYFNSLPVHDSLFAVTRIQSRCYFENGAPVNHKPGEMKRTQDMEGVLEENSNFFIFSKNSFKNAGNNRVGKRPVLFEMKKTEAADIDHEEDFLLAELIGRNRHLFGSAF